MHRRVRLHTSRQSSLIKFTLAPSNRFFSSIPKKPRNTPNRRAILSSNTNGAMASTTTTTTTMLEPAPVLESGPGPQLTNSEHGRPQSTDAANATTAHIDSLIATLKPFAKPKDRSRDTSKDVHIPLLQSHLAKFPSDGPKLVFLGDSMLERMQWTGESPNFPAPWPSQTLLPDTAKVLQDKPEKYPEHQRRLHGTFNAGVGGDKIQNVIYRLVGDEEKGLPALLPILAPSVREWVVHIGTNNLVKKKGLSARDLVALEELVKVLLTVSPGNRVLLTPLFDRTDMLPDKDGDVDVVDIANKNIKGIVERLKVAGFAVECMERPLIKTKDHLEDHVHLNLEGYQLWMEKVFPKVYERLMWSTV